MYSKVLKYISEKVVCCTIGTEQDFGKGQTMIAHYEVENGKFELRKY